MAWNVPGEIPVIDRSTQWMKGFILGAVVFGISGLIAGGALMSTLG